MNQELNRLMEDKLYRLREKLRGQQCCKCLWDKEGIVYQLVVNHLVLLVRSNPLCNLQLPRTLPR